MEDKKSKGSSSILVIVVLIFMLINLGVSVYSLSIVASMKNGKDTKVKVENKITAEDIEELPIETKKIFSLAPNENGEAYTLRMTVALGVNSKSKEYSKKKEVIESKKATITDQLDTIIRKYTVDDIRNPDTMNKIKNEIMASLNQVFDTDIVVRVYFTDIFEMAAE